MNIIRLSPPEFVDLRGVILKILDCAPDEAPINPVRNSRGYFGSSRKQSQTITSAGEPRRVISNGIKSVLLISSKKGAVRANHYHKKDTHYCYILSGRMEYTEQAVSGGKKESTILEQGDMVFTPALTIHALKALEDSEFLTLATESRGQEHYEEDTIRVNLIT